MSAVVEQGDTITLADAGIVNLAGNPADSGDIQISIKTLAGVDLAGFPMTPATHVGTGSYSQTWTCPVGQTPAGYVVVFWGNTDIPFAHVTALDVVASPTATWPDVTELASLLDVDLSITGWQTTLERILDAAIIKVELDVGDWDIYTDLPDANLSAAALRLAQIMAMKPENAAAVASDPAYNALMFGHRRTFGVA